MHSWQLSNSSTLHFHLCLVAQCSEEGVHGSPLVLFAFPPREVRRKRQLLFLMGLPKCDGMSAANPLRRWLWVTYTGGKPWLFPYLGSCVHVSCCSQAYSAAMWGRGLWQHWWSLSSWLGTAVCRFWLQDFASEVNPKHCIKTKVMSLFPQTAVRLCFALPSSTTGS